MMNVASRFCPRWVGALLLLAGCFTSSCSSGSVHYFGAESGGATAAPATYPGCYGATFNLDPIAYKTPGRTPAEAVKRFIREAPAEGIPLERFPKSGWRPVQTAANTATFRSHRSEVYLVKLSDGTWQVTHGAECP